jgi:hypothetical protein
MDKEKAQLLLGLIILGGFAFVYGLDLVLTIREAVRWGNWLPLLLVGACTLYAGGQYGYLHLKKKEEEIRRKSPTDEAETEARFLRRGTGLR